MNDASRPSDPDDQAPPRYLVGIDLGTTNCAVAFVDSSEPVWRVEILDLPQWTDWGQIEHRQTLPSFLYQLTTEERQACGQGLPWESEPAEHVAGVLARDAGMQRPGRRIASAKSWLSHDGVDRSAELLPWHGDADVRRISPVAASARYLSHIRSVWDHAFPAAPLAQQDVVITLPASFDEVARELTVAAAKQAGLPRVFLIEEPQAAFYAWIDHHRDQWEQIAKPGQTILVCDIGGGTSDFTLIRVRPAGSDANADVHGQRVQFHRVAVGNHLILGGDNLDLALASFAEQRLAQTAAEQSSNQALPPRDWDRLIQVCRVAKETLLAEERPDTFSLTLSGSGSRLIAAARTISVSGDDIDQCLVEGFFPSVPSDARPTSGHSGFREFGLPYASDPAITKHLAEFLAMHAEAGLSADELAAAREQGLSPGRPDLLLFNGGVMNAPRLRNRLVETIGSWFSESQAAGESWRPQVLEANRLDLAVAHGAAYYGMVRRGQGVRIAANLGRSYYMQVSESPPRAMCLIPASAEAGQTYSPATELQLEVGTPVQFPLWVSSTRLADTAGQLIDIDSTVLSPLPPIRTVLSRGSRRQAESIAVRIQTELSEIGTLGLFCVDATSGKRWRLEFDIRATLETDRELHRGEGEAAGIVDSETTEACEQVIRAAFAAEPKSPKEAAGKEAAGKEAAGKDGERLPPGKVMQRLRTATQLDRGNWPPSLLREIWRVLLECQSGRRQSAAHEARWLNLVGYCLRPGYGMAVDDWRVGEVWRAVHGKLAFTAPQSRSESLILWRRIAGGLTSGQQAQLLAPQMAMLAGKVGKLEAHEAAELWRMVGSLEWLPANTKTQLTELALDESARRRSQPYRAALMWAVGRLASRQPVYGPLNVVPEAAAISQFVQRVLDQPLAGGQEQLGVQQLALMQIAQTTGDRYRDLSPEIRHQVADWLRQTAAPERYIHQVLEGNSLAAQDETALFGESLPLGIRLIR